VKTTLIGIEAILPQIITITAIEITFRPHRLGKYLKLP
jgi:hypothetical protein